MTNYPSGQIFIGVDRRQPLAYSVCRSSIERHAKNRINIEPLMLEKLPIKRRGLTDFTYSRYLVPWLCDYRGTALFLDADIILRTDIGELFRLLETQYPIRHPETSEWTYKPSVCVVKNTKVRFEWPSVMFFHCSECKELTPELIETGNPTDLGWANFIGELPKEWNHCVGYDEPDPHAKLVHYTQGIPCWPETKDCEFSKEWHEEAKYAFGTVSWIELMGSSVHAKPVMERLTKAA